VISAQTADNFVDPIAMEVQGLQRFWTPRLRLCVPR